MKAKHKIMLYAVFIILGGGFLLLGMPKSFGDLQCSVKNIQVRMESGAECGTAWATNNNLEQYCSTWCY